MFSLLWCCGLSQEAALQRKMASRRGGAVPKPHVLLQLVFLKYSVFRSAYRVPMQPVVKAYFLRLYAHIDER